MKPYIVTHGLASLNISDYTHLCIITKKQCTVVYAFLPAYFLYSKLTINTVTENCQQLCIATLKETQPQTATHLVLELLLELTHRRELTQLGVVLLLQALQLLARLLELAPVLVDLPVERLHLLLLGPEGALIGHVLLPQTAVHQLEVLELLLQRGRLRVQLRALVVALLELELEHLAVVVGVELVGLEARLEAADLFDGRLVAAGHGHQLLFQLLHGRHSPRVLLGTRMGKQSTFNVHKWGLGEFVSILRQKGAFQRKVSLVSVE